MRIENSRHRHRRRRDDVFDWRPGERVEGPNLVAGKTQRGVPVIRALSAHELVDVKVWIASGCEGPQPKPSSARAIDGETP
jgi:hypothetical protein